MPLVLAYFCLGLGMAMAGNYIALSKLLIVVFPPLLLAWLRFACAAAMMATWLRPPPDEPPLNAQAKLLLFGQSFLGNFLFTICVIYGIALSNAVSAGIILAAIPAAVALLSWLFLHERMQLRLLLAIACAVGGIALLNLSANGDAADGSSLWLGRALLLGAVFCEATYVVIGKKLSSALSPKRISALINLWGLALSTPAGLYLLRDFDLQQVPLSGWLLLLYYSAAASVISVWLWLQGLRAVPAAHSGVFTVMLPIGSVLTGVLLLGETLALGQILALTLALLGIVLVTTNIVPRDASN